MKTTILCAMSLMLTLATPAAHAQQKTERAYAAFMRKVKVDARPNIVRDPQTMQLQGKGETYEFAIPDRDQALIDHVRQAMLSEADSAYKVYSASDFTHPRRLTYGGGQAVTIGSRYCNYLTLLFADRQRPGYRTAYCIEWLFPAEGKIRGRLVRVYGPDPKRHAVVPDGAALVGDTLAQVSREAWVRLAQQVDSVLSSIAPLIPVGKDQGHRPNTAGVQAGVAAVNKIASAFCERYHIQLQADKVTTQQLAKAAAEGRDKLMALLSQAEYTPEYCELQADMLMDTHRYRQRGRQRQSARPGEDEPHPHHHHAPVYAALGRADGSCWGASRDIRKDGVGWRYPYAGSPQGVDEPGPEDGPHTRHDDHHPKGQRRLALSYGAAGRCRYGVFPALRTDEAFLRAPPTKLAAGLGQYARADPRSRKGPR